jgi:iron uptake system EfeUOB component EfeO/EfeM
VKKIFKHVFIIGLVKTSQASFQNKLQQFFESVGKVLAHTRKKNEYEALDKIAKIDGIYLIVCRRKSF